MFFKIRKREKWEVKGEKMMICTKEKWIKRGEEKGKEVRFGLHRGILNWEVLWMVEFIYMNVIFHTTEKKKRYNTLNLCAFSSKTPQSLVLQNQLLTTL